MANVQFTGFTVDMFAPSYGSELIEQGLLKFAADEWDIGTATFSSIQLFTLGAPPNATFTINGAFNPSSEAALLASPIYSIQIAANGVGVPSAIVDIGSLNLTLNGFFSIDLTQGIFGGNDVISVNGSTNDVLRGYGGNDELLGGSGSDYLLGEAGNDKLHGQADAPDQMLGGTGNDTYVVYRDDDFIFEKLNEGIDTVEIYLDSYTLGKNVENLTLKFDTNIDGTGNALNNIVLGNGGNNVLSGLDGNDTLTGNAGNDRLDGGTGADTMTGGAGNDTYVVDSTLDKVIETLAGVAGGTDTVESSISHTLALNVENLTLTGDGNINATGNTLANTLTGNDGDNILNGGAGADTMAGGLGNDTYVLDNVGDVITEIPGDGIDTAQIAYNASATVPTLITLGDAGNFLSIEKLIVTGTGLFNLTGDDLNNSLTGNASANTLTGNGGDDILDGGLGIDTLDGGTGNDTYILNGADIISFDTAGNDTVKSALTYSIAARADLDNITLLGAAAINATGNDGINILTGNTAANILNGGGGNDTMIGGAGNDTYVVDSTLDVITETLPGGIDTVQSSAANFTLGDFVENLTLTGTGTDNLNGTGNTLNNILLGNGGNNVLSGLDGNDTLTGNAGNDRLDGGTGADTMTGGAGNDTYVVDSTLDKVIETLAGVAGGTDTVESSISHTLALNVENLTLTGDGNINATGNTLANTLTGNDGDNILNGGAGADTMAGGLGNDTYVLDNVGDVITEIPGDGIDTAQIAYNASATVPTLITLGDAGNFLSIEKLIVTGTGLFNLTGDDLNNSLTGNASANTLTGNGGDDILDGGLGIDTLDGGTGNDTYILNGADIISFDTAGNDTVKSALTYSIAARADLDNITLLGAAAINATGNDGINILTGNTAANILNGGGGNDTMIGGAGNDTYVVDSTLDVITETLPGGIDTVQSSAANFTLGDFVENLTLTGTGTDNLNGTGNALNNIVLGNGGNNVLSGLDGNDTLTGNAGNDRLDGGTGADTMTGGAGNDTYVVDSTLDKVIETLAGVAGGTDTVESSISHTLALNVENLTLTGDGNINATGNTLANTLTGNDGDNILNGGAGADTMAGGLGNDTYVLDNVGDVITEIPGDGIDTAQIAYNASATVPTLITLGDAGNFLSIEKLIVTGTGLFNLTGDDLNNSLTGNASANTLTGNGGDDILDGGLGIDTLDGGTGNDTYILNGADIISFDTAGNDTVKSALTYSIAARADLDNITLLGAAAINATGNDGINILTGNTAANILNGGAGADTLRGEGGNDTYIVGDGDTVIETLAGAAGGIDTVQSSAANFTLGDFVENLTLTGTGTDNLNGTGNALNNIVLGNGGNNVLSGLDGNDTLTGNAGNDRLDGGTGADTMTGGAGNDTYVVDSTLDKVIETLAGVAGGTDTVESSISHTLALNVENLTLTGDGNINATGNTLANTLTGNDGDNILNGGAGADTMAGGLGNDTYVLDNVGDVITEIPGDGIDTAQIAYNASATVPTLITLGDAGNFLSIEKLIVTGTGLFNLTGDDLNNSLTGNASANTLTGNGGDDILDGGLGIDTLDGGTGNDTYILNGADIISFDTAGNDTVKSALTYSIAARADLDNITLLGAAAINATGNDGINILTGNTAANILNGGGGNDTMIGGAGNDTYVVDSTLDVITETLPGGIDTVQSSAANFTLGDFVENLTLTGTGTDNLNGTGNTLNNILLGNGGNNVLSGLDGNDTLTGNAGNDRLDGGTGADTMTGGAGNDTYVVDSTLDKVIETLAGVAGGTDTVESSISHTLALNVENLTLTGDGNINATGNTLANTLTGNDGDNILNGGAGADTMAGGLGNDTYVLDNVGDVVDENLNEGSDTILVGGRDVDLTVNFANIENVTLTGAGAFNLTGDAADNILIGNASANILMGGDGNDTLDGKGGHDDMYGGAGDDTYMVDSLDGPFLDLIYEGVGGGSDTVVIGSDFFLDFYDFLGETGIFPGAGAELENLILTGTGNFEGEGNELDNHLVGNSGHNRLFGKAGNDNLEGRAGNDLLIGGDGDDILDGGLGNDILDGGLGDDRYVVDNPNDLVIELAGQGTDTVVASWNVDLRTEFYAIENAELGGLATTAIGDEGQNRLVGNSLDNLLQGNEGNDILDGGAGADTMVGGLGDDTFVFDNDADSAIELPGEGSDTVSIGRNVNLNLEFTNIENVTLTGTGDFSAIGNSQDNTLTGNSGANTLTGGSGNDTYVIDTAGDTVVEGVGGGSDTVVIGRSVDLNLEFSNVENATLSGTGAFNLTGNNVDNVLVGNAAVNSLVGGGGNDTLDGGTGLDQLTGGSGNDIYLIHDPQAQVFESPGGGIDTVKSTVFISDLWANVENVELLGTATSANGNTLDNILTGNDSGNILNGREGSDQLIGKKGDDSYIVMDSGDTIVEQLNEGTDSVNFSGFTGYTLPDNVENLTIGENLTGREATGNVLDNVMTGGFGNDIMHGGDGNDTLNGGLVTGNDTLFGDAGNDVLNGEFGDDILDGGAGNDRLLGGFGVDSLSGGDGDDFLDGDIAGNSFADNMSGGNGDDSFVFDLADSSVSGGAGFDTLLINAQFANFTTIGDSVYTGIESIDMRDDNPGVNFTTTLTLNVSDVLALSDTTDELWVRGDFADDVVLQGGVWTVGVVTNVGGVIYHDYTSGGATVHVAEVGDVII